MALRIWSTVPLARASASGLERRHWASSALRTASSIRRSPDSSRSCASRGTGPACSQRSWMPRRAARAARTSVTGTSFPASSSNSVLTSACSRSAASFAEYTSALARKKVSCAVLNRVHSSSSSARDARPAAFQDRISSRKAAAVADQSVESARASASAQSFSLRVRASSRSSVNSAK